MNRRTRILRLTGGWHGLWLLTVMGACSGCGATYAPLASPVTGEVHLDGRPIDMVAVFFIPTDKARHEQGLIGEGQTDANGRFVLKNPDGAETFYKGRFKVTFTRWVGKDGNAVPLTVKPTDVGAEQVLPVPYMTPTLTPIEVDVDANRTNFIFELSSTHKGPPDTPPGAGS